MSIGFEVAHYHMGLRIACSFTTRRVSEELRRQTQPTSQSSVPRSRFGL